MDRVTVGGRNGKINFHNFIMIVIPSKFTIDFSEIEKVPKYALNKHKKPIHVIERDELYEVDE